MFYQKYYKSIFDISAILYEVKIGKKSPMVKTSYPTNSGNFAKPREKSQHRKTTQFTEISYNIFLNTIIVSDPTSTFYNMGNIKYLTSQHRKET